MLPVRFVGYKAGRGLRAWSRLDNLLAKDKVPLSPDRLENTRTLIMSSEPTSFFSLPGELRNEIYKLALVQPDPVSIDARGVTPRILDSPSTSTSRVLALLLANKQIYSEARAIFYHDNSFRVVTNGLNPVPNRPARADDKDETQFKQSNFDIYIKFQHIRKQKRGPMTFCGHVWPVTFQA